MDMMTCPESAYPAAPKCLPSWQKWSWQAGIQRYILLHKAMVNKNWLVVSPLWKNMRKSVGMMEK
jgi:hypothetical protein